MPKQEIKSERRKLSTNLNIKKMKKFLKYSRENGKH